MLLSCMSARIINDMSADFQCNLADCKKIEAARKECEEQFRATFDHLNDGLLVLDQNGHIQDANRIICERLNYARDELLGMHVGQLDSPEYAHKVAESFALANSQGHAIFESEHRCKEGGYLPVEINIRVIETDEGQIYFSVIRDLTERRDNERALQIMQLSVDNMGDGAFWITRDAKIAYANAAACTILGYSIEEMMSMHVFDLDPKMNPDIWPIYWNKTRMQGSCTIESTHVTKYGRHIPVEISVNHLRYEDEEYHCTFVRDISKRKQEQRALKMMQFAMDNMGDAVFWSTSDGRIAYANIAACRALDYAPDEMLSLRVFDFDQHIDAARWPAHWQELKLKGSLMLESNHRGRSGCMFPVELSLNFMQFEGEEYICAFVRDISMRKLADEKIARLAHFDAITNLPNRALLYDRLELSIALAQRNNQRLAVLFLDLDGFKQVNDNHGHYVGDDLLKAVAERLRENARDTDTVARVGGDEFIFILNEIGKPANAAIVAEKVIASLALPFVIQGKACQIGGSIGISVFPEDGKNMEDIIKQADDAMYLAKKNGKGNYQFSGN